jgi:hypothetical protein
MQKSFYKILLQQECIQLVLILTDARRRHATLTTGANTRVPKQHVQVSEWHVYISWKLLKFVSTITRIWKYPTQSPLLTEDPSYCSLPSHSSSFNSTFPHILNFKHNTKRPVQIVKVIPTKQETCPPYDRIKITFTRYSTALRLSLLTASQLWPFSKGIKLVPIYYSNKLNHSKDNAQTFSGTLEKRFVNAGWAIYVDALNMYRYLYVTASLNRGVTSFTNQAFCVLRKKEFLTYSIPLQQVGWRGGGAGTGLIWLRIGTGGGLL